MAHLIRKWHREICAQNSVHIEKFHLQKEEEEEANKQKHHNKFEIYIIEMSLLCHTFERA